MVESRKSAHKHGLTKEDIDHALRNRIVELDLDPQTEPPKVLVIGPDLAGNLIEIFCITKQDRNLIAIHAMALRKKYEKYIPGRRK